MRTTQTVPGLLGALILGALTACSGSAHDSQPVAVGSAPSTGYAEKAVSRATGIRCNAPSVIAHRGETGDDRGLPENSAQAELAAATEGATFLNLDVRWTNDDVPVALHDPTVDRTTSEAASQVPITSLTAAQYTALDSRAYAGDTSQGPVISSAHPQTLAFILTALARTDRPVIVQMEGDPYHLPGLPAAAFASLAEVVERSPDAGRVIVAGWTMQDLAAFHADDPRAPLAFLYETIGAHGYPAPAQLKAAGVQILYIDYRGVTAKLVKTWHEQGLRVWVWTPEWGSEWQRMRADGVDAIATDKAQTYLSWAGPPQPCGAQYE